MGGVVDAISDAWDSVWETVADVWDGIQDTLTDVWRDYAYPVFEFVFNLLGFHDEIIVSTEAITQRLIEGDGSYEDLMTQVALAHQQDEDGSVISHLAVQALSISAKYNSYHSYGKEKYVHGLPTTNIRSNNVPSGVIKTVVDSIYSIDSLIITNALRIPDKAEWVASELRASHNYNAYNETLAVSGVVYDVDYIDYNYSTNKYDVTYSGDHTVTVDTTTTTAVTITNIDAATDNKNTAVSERVVTTSSIDGETSDVTTEISNFDEVVPIGTEVDSVNVVETTEEYVDVYNSGVIVVNAFNTVLHVVAQYYTVESGEYQYWVYEMGSGVYPAVDTSKTYYSNIEMLPIVALRNNFVDLADSPTSTEYLQAQEMLDILGMDIESLTDAVKQNPDQAQLTDAFIHFSINFADSTPIIDKLLYETFALMYEDLDLINIISHTEVVANNEHLSLEESGGNIETESSVTTEHTAYTATVTEGAYNIAMVWEDQTKVVTTGSIGEIGTYSKSISGENLIVQKQVTDNSYLTYTLYKITTLTRIDRDGESGIVTKDLSSGSIEMPLVFFFLDTLTPLEQNELYPYTLKMSFYAAQITVIDWYNTSSFMFFIKIVLIVIVVVTTILTGGLAGGFWAIVWNVLVNLAVGYAIQYALGVIYRSVDDANMRIALSILVIAAGAYLGSSFSSGEFLSAAQLSTMVTQSSTSMITAIVGGVNAGSRIVSMETNLAMEKLADEKNQFTAEYDAKMEAIYEQWSAVENNIETEDVVSLNSIEVNPYLKGIDYWYWEAKGGPQYMWDTLFDGPTLAVSDFHGNAKRVGVNG